MSNLFPRLRMNRVISEDWGELQPFQVRESRIKVAARSVEERDTSNGKKGQPRTKTSLLLLLSLRGISNRFQLLFPSQGQVLARYSPVRHWKHHFPSDLHVLSMPPAFILSQDQTLHEIPSYITYSFLLRRQSWFGIVFHSKASLVFVRFILAWSLLPRI